MGVNALTWYEQVSPTDVERVTRIYSTNIVREGFDTFRGSFYAILNTGDYYTPTTTSYINKVIESMGWKLERVKSKLVLRRIATGETYPFQDYCKVYINGLFVEAPNG